MTLDSYIKELLYRYECVIVPDFGGFVTNKIGARLDKNKSTFYPPSKQITFNSHLKINDGLLANYIVAVENISYENALQKIKILVADWKSQLQKDLLEIKDLGTLKLNSSHKILFEPYNNTNYLAESFGLASYAVAALDTQETKVVPLTATVNKNEKEKKGIPVFVKYAATAAILLTLGVAGFNGYTQYQQKEDFAKQEKALEEKIQSATFVISDPLPTLKLKVTKEVIKPYHVVAGAFQFPENAAKKVTQLKQQGFDAKIIGINKYGLTEVVFASFVNRNDAINELYKIQDTVSEDAWLLVKK